MCRFKSCYPQPKGVVALSTSAQLLSVVSGEALAMRAVHRIIQKGVFMIKLVSAIAGVAGALMAWLGGFLKG